MVREGRARQSPESGRQIDHSEAFLTDFLIRLIRLLYGLCALRDGSPGALPVDERYLTKTSRNHALTV